MNELGEEGRKRLTEFLGECWHKQGWASIQINNGPAMSRCKFCEQEYNLKNDGHRTFKTSDDFFALKNKLVDRGKWEKFIVYCFNHSKITKCQDLTRLYGGGKQIVAQLTDWLINAKRFCSLVAAFIEDKNNE